MSDLVELKATRTLLEKGVKVQVPAPLFFRLFGKKQLWLTVHQPTAGNRLRIGEVYLSMGLEIKGDIGQLQAEELLVKNGKKIARICAIAMLKGYWLPKFFSGLLGRYLFRNLTFRQMLVLVQILIVGGDTQDFIDTIRFIKAVLITAPNVSHKTQRS